MKARIFMGIAGAAIALAAFGLGRCTGEPHAAGEAAGAAEAPADQVWTCSMHPNVRQDGPGICPLCGMDLVPASSLGGADDGPTEVSLSPRAAALVAVRTTEVRAEDAERSEVLRRFVARVALDETRRDVVTSWIGGRVDRLHVRATGQRVARGQVVATLYSPEVYAAHQELLSAKRVMDRLEGPAREGAALALEAARDRLRLLGVPDAELAAMEEAERPTRAVAVRSPAAGTVMERLVTQGTYVSAGTPLYSLARLDRVWAQLEVYERDLPLVRVGQPVALRFEGLPDPLVGEVAFVSPVVDARRRVAEVRVSVPSGGVLRPGMVGEATVQLVRASRGPAWSRRANGPPLVIPATAPLFTGRRSVVYVEVPGRERPTYEARGVTLGPRRGEGADAIYPVLDGLREGERVVVHGAFTLDAELQIRGGISMMAREGESSHVELDEVARGELAPVIEGALEIAARLAADDPEAALDAARVLRMRVDGVTLAGDAGEAWAALATPLMEQAHAVAHARTIAEMRAAFEPLSASIERVLSRFGNPTDVPVRVAHCPMAFDDRGARWVQRGEVVDNAYFGDAMRTCGTIEATVAPGARLEGLR
ncbi:MAG: efflux RND transporter periplasmic adaptor subunit [Myxococcales bacterium]|nr:efflux RND transporter periplasmic adaptor subunit [Myxococcales bacterium]